jgi:hypothetical protein
MERSAARICDTKVAGAARQQTQRFAASMDLLAWGCDASHQAGLYCFQEDCRVDVTVVASAELLS